MANYRLLIDADVLVYEAGFAAQKTVYEYKHHTFKDAKEAKAFCQEHELDYRALRKADEISSRVEVLPESAAKNIYRMKLDGILNKLQSENYLLLLSGDGNFRDKVGVTKGYKANRANTPKPHHYLFVRDLVLNDPRSELTVGVEADDAMGMYVTDDPSSIICSIDKDLNQIPCRHYDWGKGLKYTVNREQALYWFHRQLLSGDATDNIPGIPGIGDKGADNHLADLRDDPGRSWKYVYEMYNEGPFEFKDGTRTSDNLTDYLVEQGQLLWMMREPGERWTPELHEAKYL